MKLTIVGYFLLHLTILLRIQKRKGKLPTTFHGAVKNIHVKPSVCFVDFSNHSIDERKQCPDVPLKSSGSFIEKINSSIDSDFEKLNM